MIVNFLRELFVVECGEAVFPPVREVELFDDEPVDRPG
jgi:hypothetical protein